MGEIKNKELFSEIKSFSAIYVDDDGKIYEIGYQESFYTNIGYTEKFLNFVEIKGKRISEENNSELWERIRAQLEGF